MKECTILELYQGLDTIVNKFPYYELYTEPILLRNGFLRQKITPKLEIDREQKIAILKSRW